MRTENSLVSSTFVPGEIPAGAKRGKVLVVDDDDSVRRAIETALRNLHFEVAGAPGAEAAAALLQAFRYDAVLLDIAMPGMNGIEACRHLRRIRPQVGILMITVHDSEETVIEALDAGADDYVTKPFHVGELAARLRSLLRRARASDRKSASIKIGDIELDPARRAVHKNGAPIHLTPKEFELLAYLMANAGLPIPHARLLSAVWGPEYGQELEYLRTFIRQLRKKLGDDATQPVYLRTLSHLGYSFRPPDDEAE